MGQEVRREPAAAALTAEPERSIGAYLARQRELRGISLDELATLTRIPRRSLERLESGVFDRAPDGFVRGFVRTVAAALGLDPDEAVMRLLREPAADVEGGPGGLRWPTPAARWVAIACGGLLLAGAVGWITVRLLDRPRISRSDEIVMRRDPVRELVLEEERSARAMGGEAPAEEIP